MDSGHAIGTVAELTPEQLRQRIAEIQLPEKITSFSRPVRLAILGATLSRRLRADMQPDRNATIEPVGSFQDRQAFLDAADELDADVLVVELPFLDNGSAAEVRTLSRHCGVSRALAVFGFGSREAAANQERQGITALRFPVIWEEICLLAGAGTLPPRQQRSMDFEVSLMEQALKKVIEVEGIDLNDRPAGERIVTDK